MRQSASAASVLLFRTARPIVGLACAFAVFTGSAGLAQAGLRLGVVAPEGEESFAAIGDQIRQGVRVYADGDGASVDAVVTAPETCDAASGRRAARSMIAAGVDAVAGFVCVESLDAALPVLAHAGIPTVTVDVRADVVMEDALSEGWPFFRLAPRAGAEVDTIVDVIATRWSGEPFALVEDGTIYGRELAESVRVGLEDMGITAAFIDTYRPAQEKQFGLAHRLERAGVTRVFIGGGRSDVAVIARDCASLDLGLTFMGGDAMQAADGEVPLQDGILAVTTPDLSTRASARTAVSALKAAGLPAYDERLRAYAAAQILDAGKAATDSADKLLSSVLQDRDFKTVLGPIRFNEKHERNDQPFRLTIWRDGRFVPADSGG